ncbi:zinc finger protein [Anopheles sinensis]|uniref:Zinc finger protein n=1 Tax=Anopheles sinensis TaxID=74873 RepID=A0A084W9J3_ANOSI|nr:zinc finger protein [Anopheles sinensis]
MQHRSRAHMFQIQVRALIKTLKCLQSDDKYQALLFLISAIKLYVKFLYNDCQERLYKPAILKELNNIENVIVVNLLKARGAGTASASASSVATARTSASSYGGGLASTTRLDLGSTSIRSTDLSLGGDGLLMMHPHRTQPHPPLMPWDLRGKLLRGNLFDGLPPTDSVRLGANISAAACNSLLKGGHRLASAARWLGNVRMTRALVRMIANHDFKLLFNMFEQSIFPTWKIYKNERIFVRKRPALTTVTVRTSLPAICYGSGSSHSPPATYIKKEEFDFDPPYSIADDHCFEEIKDEDDDDLLLMKEDDSIDISNEIFSEEESSTNNTSLMLSSDTNTLDTNDSSMVSHERNKEQSYQCLLCDKSYRKRKSLVIHFNLHPGYCPDCGKQRGVTSDEIVEHNRIYHKNRPHICEHCGETFTRNQQYQIHVQGHFISQKRVAEQNCKKIHKHCCKTCGIVFNNQKYLEKHIQKTNHQTEGVVCEICGAIFCNSVKLNHHVTRMHNNVFSQKASLERTMLLQQTSTSVVEKSYCCDHCGLAFLSQTTLRDHIKLAHTSLPEDVKSSQTATENKFECNICNKLFAAKRSLKRHKLCHSEERAFRCTVDNCKDAYKNQSHLARHMKTVHHIEPQKRLPKGKAAASAAAATAAAGGSSGGTSATLSTSTTGDPSRASSASADFIGHGIGDGVTMGGGSCDSLKVGGGGALKKSALGSSEKSLGDSSTNFSDNMSSFNYEFSDTTGGGSSTPALPSLGGREEGTPTLLSSAMLGAGSGSTMAPRSQAGAFNDPGISFATTSKQQQHNQLQQQHLSWQNLEFGSVPQHRSAATLAGGGGGGGGPPAQPMQDPLATQGSFMDAGHSQHHNLHHQAHHPLGPGAMGDPMGGAGGGGGGGVFMASNMMPGGARRFPLPETNLTCEHCDETNFVNAQQFQVHVQDHFVVKEGKEPAGKKLLRLICKTCNLVFATGPQLDRHIQKTNHHTESIACEICSAIFNSNLKVYQHMLKCHKNDIWFACEQCSKVFILKQDYDKHQLVHQTVTDRSIICEHCASSFLTQEALKEHIKIAHSMDKKYKCTICNKLFAARRSLKRHKLCHEEEAAFRCPVDGCTEAFRTAANLAKHKKMAHPAGLVAAPAPQVPGSIVAGVMVAHDSMGEPLHVATSKLPGTMVGGPLSATASGTMKVLEKVHQEPVVQNASIGQVMPGHHGTSPLMAMNASAAGMLKTEPRPSPSMGMVVPPSRTSSAGSSAGLGGSNTNSGSGANMPYNPYEASSAMHYNSVGLGVSPGSNIGPAGHGHHAALHHHHHHMQQQQQQQQQQHGGNQHHSSQQALPHHHSQSQFVGMTNPAGAAGLHYTSAHGGSRGGTAGTSSNLEQQQQPSTVGYRMAGDGSASVGPSGGNTGNIPYGYAQMANAYDWQNMAEMGNQTAGVEAGGIVGGANPGPTQVPSASASSMKGAGSKYYNAMHENNPGGAGGKRLSNNELYDRLQDMWNANMMKMEFQEEGTGGNGNSGAYNSLGNILTNLEMIGGSSNFESQAQQQQQQQQQGYDMIPASRTSADPHLGNGASNQATTLPTDVAKAQANNLPFVDSFTESIDYLQQSFQYV